MDKLTDRQARFSALNMVENDDVDPAGTFTTPDCQVLRKDGMIMAQVWIVIPEYNFLNDLAIEAQYGPDAK